MTDSVAGDRVGSVDLRALPFVLAVVVAVALVLSAPFVGQVRSYIRAAYPGQFVTIVGGIVVLAVGLALLIAFRRIRERRMPRYLALAAALAIAAGYAAWNAGPSPESNAVERFHFVQYGLITFLFYRAWRPLSDLSVLLLPVLAGLIVGAAEEWFQWFIPNRVGELNDVFLNLVAIGSGLLFSLGLDPPRAMHAGLRRGARARVARLAAAAFVALAAFVHAVHFGYMVEDEEIGAFESRYDRETLLGIQAQRAAEWQHSPPPTTLVRVSREDQYLTEGIQHVRRRNTLWSEGDYRGAWLENRILEKYYHPVLETPTHEGPSGHRWPADQRADAELRAAERNADAPFVSGAYPFRVLQWNRLVFWALVGLLAGSLLLLAQRPERAGKRYG